MAEPDRRTSIADAALRLLGREGSRMLTHRGVDAEAGLAEGSTSYYCRRRSELVALALERHAALEHDALETLGNALAATAVRPAVRLRRFATALTRWITTQDYVQAAARYELFLLASRDPELSQALSAQRVRFVTTLEQALRKLGVRQSRHAAPLLIALIEGTLLERVRERRAPVELAPLRAWIRSLASD